MNQLFSFLFLLVTILSCQSSEEKKFFEEGQKNKPITLDSRTYEEEVFTVVDTFPEFPGGDEKIYEFYSENSKYPLSDQNKAFEEVYFIMVIDEKGEVWNYRIMTGKTKYLKENTEMLIEKMPNWKPGLRNGVFVKTQITMSIKYAL